MRYAIEQDLLSQYPNFFRGVVIATGMNGTDMDTSELERRFRERIVEISNDDNITSDHARIHAWSEIYRSFLSNGAGRVRPSIQNLVRRIKSGKGDRIPFVMPVVCVSNLVSLEGLVPSGAVDASLIEGDLVLGYAQGTEIFEPIGSDEQTYAEPGEVIYYDDKSLKVLCRAWNSRAGRPAMIRPDTTSIILDIDGLDDVVSRSEVEHRANSAAQLLQKFCGAKTEVHLLSRDRPTFEFEI